MAKRTDTQQLGDDQAALDRHLFLEAVTDGVDEENNGDRGPETMHGSLEGDVNDDEDPEDGDEVDGEDEGSDEDGKDDKDDSKDDTEGKPDDKADPKDDEEEPSRGDPKVPLREERAARRAAEARANEAETTANRLLTRLEALERRITEPAAKPAARVQEDEEPDVFADPKGFKDSIIASTQKAYTMRRVEETFADAHEAHGRVFEAAYEGLKKLDPTNPTDRALVQRISNSANPGKALIKWHNEQTVIREIGDPTAYKARLREELLSDPEVKRQILQDLRDEAEGNKGSNVRRLNRNPPSLNSGTRGSSGRGRDADPTLHDDSDESAFEYATR